MRSSAMMWALLFTGVVLSSGASAGGVGQARDWQYSADVALALGDKEIAYTFYSKIAEIFPDTAHGRLAAARARSLRSAMLRPELSPAKENVGSVLGEIVDFLTWP